MKKIFLTTAAALVASGGAFAMDGSAVSVGADGNFGVKFNEANDGHEAQFHHEFDVKFSAALTSDDGFVFGGSIKIDQGNGAHDARTFMTIDNHTVTVGDGLDAGDNFGPLGLADLGFDGIGVDDVGEALRGKTDTDVTYDGDYGIVDVRMSVGDADDSGAADEEFAFGLGIDLAPMTAGIGFDSRGVVSLGGTFTQGVVKAGFLFSTDDDWHDGDTRTPDGAMNYPGDQEATAFGADATYSFSDTTKIILSAAQSEMDGAPGTASTEKRAFGIGFEHNLGGGATLAGGVGSIDDGTDSAVGDLGISMKF